MLLGPLSNIHHNFFLGDFEPLIAVCPGSNHTKNLSDLSESRLWSLGKDQSLSGVMEVGGPAVSDEVRASLRDHITNLNEKWKSGNQYIVFFCYPPFLPPR